MTCDGRGAQDDDPRVGPAAAPGAQEPHVGPAAAPGAQDEPHVGPAAAPYMDEYWKGKAHARAAQDLLIERGCGCCGVVVLCFVLLFVWLLFMLVVLP